MIPEVPPALVLGTMLCLGYAALLHLWLGRNLRDLIMMLVMAAIGFGFGQVMGALTNLPILQIGQLHVVEASVGAWLLMAIARLIAP
ncbi:MAG: hypothetical protein KF832_07240 [Caldilineaceae bacterium]|nr:hypothetical protein [Caldilineaceae bacterium]